MQIIGLMWAKNEADIIEEVIEAALPKVDGLMICDDRSTDGTWDKICSYKSQLEYRVQKPKGKDRLWGQNHLLDLVRSRYKVEDTWIQIIESDIMILDTDVREAIKRFHVNDAVVHWQALNAVSKDWTETDTYPKWDKSIKEIMPCGHWMEKMLYTFRPFPELRYVETKPWPKGFAGYKVNDTHRKHEDSPLLAHYGYRGPTHFHLKYKHMGKSHSRYRDWKVDSPENVLKTVPYFNGEWNGKSFPMSREGWIKWIRGY